MDPLWFIWLLWQRDSMLWITSASLKVRPQTDGLTVIHLAAVAEILDAVDYFCKSQIRPQTEGLTVVHLAAVAEILDAVDYFCKSQGK